MDFLITVLGVVLVLEGMPWFLSPKGMKKYLRQMLAAPEATLRALGLMLMLTGLLMVYLVRG